MQHTRFVLLPAATALVAAWIAACRGDEGVQTTQAPVLPLPARQEDAAVPPADPRLTAGRCGPLTFAARYGGSLPASWVPDETARALASDASGALYVTGWSRNANFGSGASAAGDPALFVMKLDASRARVWDRTFGNETPGLVGSYAAGTAMASHPLGGVLVAGTFAGILALDGPVLRSTVQGVSPALPCSMGDGSDCATDAFVARFDAEGATSFAARFGGAGYDAASDVTFDNRGTAIVGGTFSDEGEFGGTVLKSAGSYDIFVVRISASGATLGSFRLGGRQEETLAGVAAMPDGDIVVAGTFTLETTIGGTKLSSADLDDGFVARVSPTGEARWANALGSAEGMDVRSVKTDEQGNIYVGGALRTSLKYNAPEGVALEDAFVLALDAGGQRRWRKTWGAGRRSSVSSLSLDAEGAVVAVGTTLSGSAIDFGGGPIGGGAHAWPFVVDLDSTGAHRCSRAYSEGVQPGAASAAVSASTPTGASGHSVLAIANRSIVFGGAFNGTVNLGSGPVTAQGGSDIYFAEVAR